MSNQQNLDKLFHAVLRDRDMIYTWLAHLGAPEGWEINLQVAQDHMTEACRLLEELGADGFADCASTALDDDGVDDPDDPLEAAEAEEFREYQDRIREETLLGRAVVIKNALSFLVEEMKDNDEAPELTEMLNQIVALAKAAKIAAESKLPRT